MIADQRAMYGRKHQTVEDVQAFWVEWTARHGLPLVTDPRPVQPYVSEGRWVGDCPECNGGIACWDQNPHGCCLTCGHMYPIVWHPDTASAAETLEVRPGRNQHWRPHLGETVAILERENALMRHELGGR